MALNLSYFGSSMHQLFGAYDAPAGEGRRDVVRHSLWVTSTDKPAYRPHVRRHRRLNVALEVLYR